MSKVVLITMDDERIVHFFDTDEQAITTADRLRPLGSVKSASACVCSEAGLFNHPSTDVCEGTNA